jgi:small subunit ribosomal protein S2
VLEGKAAAPITAAEAKDEFVELDAEGNPVAKEDAGKRRAAPPRKQAGDRRPPSKRPAAKRGARADAEAGE